MNIYKIKNLLRKISKLNAGQQYKRINHFKLLKV